MQHISITYYKTEVSLKDPEEIFKANFFSPEDARFAIAWAFYIRMEELKERKDAFEIEEYSLDDYNRKIVWWKKVTGGYKGQKDYFSAVSRTLKASIINSMNPTYNQINVVG